MEAVGREDEAQILKSSIGGSGASPAQRPQAGPILGICQLGYFGVAETSNPEEKLLASCMA